jgi:hypothetical protein
LGELSMHCSVVEPPLAGLTPYAIIMSPSVMKLDLLSFLLSYDSAPPPFHTIIYLFIHCSYLLPTMDTYILRNF